MSLGINPTAPPMSAGAYGPGTPSNGGTTAPPSTNVISFNTVRATPLAAMTEADRKDAEDRQTQPMITGLAGHIKHKFTIARDFKRLDIEPRMVQNLRARRSEYDPDKLTAIRQMGGSDVYAGITSLKCSAAASWIKDVMLGQGDDRPWSISPTPIAELPPEINELIVNQAVAPLKQALMAGAAVDPMQTVNMLSMMRDQAMAALKEEASKRVERMAAKMEDQLIEGGFLTALDGFIDDMVTFPSAILKGPVIRMRPRLSWGPDGQPVVNVKLVKEWERADPFKIYPAPSATTIDDSDLIEKHRLSRKELQALIGVDGYDKTAINMVLEMFSSGLDQWLFDTSEQAQAEGRPTSMLMANPDGLIDALQYWGSVQGQMLLDWGMDTKKVPNPQQEYEVEAWVIGPYVIKAVLNPDPLNRRPYYKASYREVPGSFWGHSVADLVRDPQTAANSALRNMINNAALSSGPQVGVLVDRLAAGEDVTQMQPWRIWQLTADPMNGGSYQPPITFFQPQSNVQELMIMFDKFMTMADEFSGIPKYMTGNAQAGGAGRTASGLSMLMTNAGKSISAVIGNVDLHVIEPALDRLYYYNMRFETDPDLKGDVCIEARGSKSLIAKESAQVRRNEFLMATNNPTDMQIVGVEGRAAVLREVAKGLDMDTDKIVPPIEILRQKFAAMAALNAPPGQGGSPPAPGSSQTNEQTLMDGSPINDNMSPPAMSS